MKGAFIFVIGFACGAAVAGYLTKKKYETILDEEIQSVKDVYSNKCERTETAEDLSVRKENDELYKAEMEKLKQISENKGYINYNKFMNGELPEEESVVDTDQYVPFVIDEEEFGTNGYDTVTLTYYADGVLVDDVDEVISPDDYDIIVGKSNLSVFEEFGALSVMVRNDLYRIDYDIVKDDWNYSDISEYATEEERIRTEAIIARREKKPHELD